MKYYIPISSINVDNVLSSESISPVSFYKKRDFGYRSFEALPGISLTNDILLLSVLPFFSINDSERENFPVVLEIEDDNQLKNKIRKTNTKINNLQLFLCDETIYLTPWNCKILFFSDKAKVFTKLNCEDSLCNKLGHLFRFEVVTPGLFRLSEAVKGIIFKESDSDYSKISIDIRINRIKGLLYGYYLGSKMYKSEDVANLVAIQKKIYNIVATIISSNGKISQNFLEKLLELEKQYNKYDPRIKQLKNLWDKKIMSRFSSESDKQAFEQILQNLSIEADAKLIFCKKHGIRTRDLKFTAAKHSIDWSSYQRELSTYTQSILLDEIDKLPSIRISDIIDINHQYSGVTSKINSDTRFNCVLSRFFFDQATTIEDLRLNKFEVATDYTKGIKSIMLSENKIWEDSSESLFYNSLRINIKSSEPFDLKQAPSTIDLSIAAFLLKGEDFGSLMRYLEELGVHEYKYVLSFWGAATGYVDIPKTVFKSIITPIDSFCEKYREISHLLFNDSLKGSFPEIIKKNSIQKRKDPFTPTLENEKLLGINKNELHTAVESVRYKLKKFNKAQTVAVGDTLTKAETPSKFLSILKSHKGCGDTSKIYKAFKTYFNDDKLISKSDGDLFQNANDKPNILDELVCFRHINFEILNRLKDNWKYVLSKNSDKADVISHFINLCKKEGEGRSAKVTVLKDFFTQQTAEDCKKELEEKYDR